jgi:hypothetical protein
MMNTVRLAFFTLAVAFSALSMPSRAQTPASHPLGGYQPLSPTAVNIGTLGRKTIPGNVVGQYVTKNGTYYVVETRRGRTVVDQWALLGLPSLPPHPDRRRHPLPNVHYFH